MKTARFGSDGTTTPSLFMVDEAEAAAMHALTADHIVLNMESAPSRNIMLRKLTE